MDTNEYPPDLDRRPHTQLDRHFLSGDNTYHLTASGTGDDRVRLAVTGWGPAGEVVSELSGGISPADLPAVTDALTSTLTGLAALRARRGTLRTAGRKPRRHPNRGVRWSTEDDERLVARYREGASERDLMDEFGRSRGGIRARLEILGEAASDTELRYRSSDTPAKEEVPTAAL
ncbi:hypothetical protein AB0M36_20730 [Actinoplanes sp. NPDC051346]|uniref:hypothetical protein n=1 Tax=Actinoplanes sp. NPDC051346 TaxID=3155048 RepID=UPI0034353319